MSDGAQSVLRGLGFRAAQQDEVEGALASTLALAAMRPEVPLPATILHADPVISYSGLTNIAPLGLASLAAGTLSNRPAWFLLSPTWTVETTERVHSLRALAVLHRRGNPLHHLVFIGNTPEETDLLQQAGEAAFFYNKTANVREDVFRPVPNIPADLDAIYTARLLPWKRHELSLGIPRCGFLFYRDDAIADAAAAEAAIMARHAQAAPGHLFINRRGPDGRPVQLPPASVNWHLNRASVGLCLSESEGAAFASLEYLLSGLPIVSTPSKGGRHVYYEDEYSLIVPPDPRAVAEAARALAARQIPRMHIHDRIVQRITADRARFLDLLNAILEASGRVPAFGPAWPFDKPILLQWTPAAKALDRARRGEVDAIGLGNRHRRLLMRSTSQG